MGTRKCFLQIAVAIMFMALLAGCIGCSASRTQSNGEGTPCREDELSPSAVMRSTDHGATWTSLGRICMHDPSILSVDFTAIPLDGGGVALYFVDMKLLQQPPTVQRIIYRSTSMDGVNFDKPQAAVTANVDMFDPTVIRLPDGKVRLYVPMADVLPGIASFISDDGLHFTRESGTRNANGGMPGALVLAAHRIRMFAGNVPGADQAGIGSMISDDGLTFAAESGVRIVAASPKPTDMPGDPSAIHLIGGGYLMAFMINPTEPYIATGGQYRLATSDDGFTWTVNPTIFAEGGTSYLVETSDGRSSGPLVHLDPRLIVKGSKQCTSQ
jgi:hypothetical protein